MSFQNQNQTCDYSSPCIQLLQSDGTEEHYVSQRDLFGRSTIQIPSNPFNDKGFIHLNDTEGNVIEIDIPIEGGILNVQELLEESKRP